MSVGPGPAPLGAGIAAASEVGDRDRHGIKVAVGHVHTQRSLGERGRGEAAYKRALELDADAHRRLRGALVHAAVTYAWLDADLGDVAEGVQYKYALTNARHLLQATSTVDVRGLRLGLQGLWKERLTGESYAVLNGRVAYRMEAGPGSVTVSVEARNMFDVEYTEVFNAPMPGRWWIFGVRLRQ